jgi:hypothetical protein
MLCVGFDSMPMNGGRGGFQLPSFWVLTHAGKAII